MTLGRSNIRPDVMGNILFSIFSRVVQIGKLNIKFEKCTSHLFDMDGTV